MAAPLPLATIQDLSDWLGEPIAEDSAEGKRAAMCLRIASALVRKEAARTWLNESGTLDSPPEDAVMVTVYCAARVFENPNAQTRGGLDDHTESWKVDEAGAYLTASEKRMLAQFRTAAFGGIGIVTTTRSEYSAASKTVPTGTPDVELPWY